jgi:hypothetical protein
MFRSVVELSPNDLLACVYLTINKVWAFLSVPPPLPVRFVFSLGW